MDSDPIMGHWAQGIYEQVGGVRTQPSTKYGDDDGDDEEGETEKRRELSWGHCGWMAPDSSGAIAAAGCRPRRH
eukprot:7664133-Pyramimonas_sp.AAC.2